MLDKIVEELLYYSYINLDLDSNDIIYTRNLLLHEFNILKPYEGEIDKEYIKSLDTVTPLINELKDELKDINDFEIERIMSFLSPKPSFIINKFNSLLLDDPKKATDYFYNLMVKNNYIRLDDIKRNKFFEYKHDYRKLEITINLSKPEKDNKDIIKEAKIESVDYPKCLLCDTNEGYYGGGKFQARSNIRLIPLKLNGDDWFFQYSPYAYFNEHMIAVDRCHTPMIVNKDSITKELDFVDILPHYFIGQNSDLPIVGGSLLSHHHFQGGEHLMPMLYSRSRYNLKSEFNDVNLSYLDWYNSCLLLKSNNKESIIDCADYIINKYESYDDLDIELISNDSEGRHSTITTITRKVDDTYFLYMIFRNNRCNKEYPDGIFHAHTQYHNIKKEGIGLIEATGLFILPGRLLKELDLIMDILSESYKPVIEYIEKYSELEKHLDFINKLIIRYGRRHTKDQAKEIIKNEIGSVCEHILLNTSIFKDTMEGQLHLMKFFKYLNFEVIK